MPPTSTPAAIRLTGALTRSTREQLGQVPDSMIISGVRQIAVHLATPDQVDAELLQMLRDARNRVDGLLVLAAGRPGLRLSLRLVGLDGPARPRPAAPGEERA